MIELPSHITAGMGSDATDKLGAIAAHVAQLQSQGLPSDQIAATIQKEMESNPGMIPFKNAYALFNYLKSHPNTPPPPSPDTSVVGMAKTIAAQDTAKKMAAMPRQAPPMPYGGPPMPQGPMPQGPMPQGPMVHARSGGLADLDAHNIGNEEHYAKGGIVAFGEGDLVQANIGSDAQLQYLNQLRQSQIEAQTQQQQKQLLSNSGAPMVPPQTFSAAHGGQVKHFDGTTGSSVIPQPLSNEQAGQLAELQRMQSERMQKELSIVPSTGNFTDMYDQFGDPDARTRETVIRQTNPLYQDLLKRKNDYDAYVKQQAQINATQKYAQEHNIVLPPSPAPTSPAATPAANSDVPAGPPPVNIRKYFSQNAGIGTQGGTAAPLQLPHPEADQVYTPKGVDDTFKELIEMKNKYGLDNATAAFDTFLDNQQTKLQKNFDFEKNMGLAQIGFKLASTHGPLLAAAGEAAQAGLPSIMAAKQNQQSAENNIAKEKLLAARAIEQENVGMMRDAVIGHRADSQFAGQMNAQKNLLQMERERTDATLKAHMATLAATKPMADLDRAYIAALQAGDMPSMARIQDAIQGITPSIYGGQMRIDATSIENFRKQNQPLISQWSASPAGPQRTAMEARLRSMLPAGHDLSEIVSGVLPTALTYGPPSR